MERTSPEREKVILECRINNLHIEIQIMLLFTNREQAQSILLTVLVRKAQIKKICLIRIPNSRRLSRLGFRLWVPRIELFAFSSCHFFSFSKSITCHVNQHNLFSCKSQIDEEHGSGLACGLVNWGEYLPGTQIAPKCDTIRACTSGERRPIQFALNFQRSPAHLFFDSIELLVFLSVFFSLWRLFIFLAARAYLKVLHPPPQRKPIRKPKKFLWAEKYWRKNNRNEISTCNFIVSELNAQASDRKAKHCCWRARFQATEYLAQRLTAKYLRETSREWQHAHIGAPASPLVRSFGRVATRRLRVWVREANERTRTRTVSRVRFFLRCSKRAQFFSN